MNFLKAHMVPLICAAVIVLALLAYFVWPLPGYSLDLHNQEDSRLKTADRFKAASKVPIVIPGVQPFNGPITPYVIEKKTIVQQKMRDNADQIKALASQDNEGGRIVRHGKKVIPLLDGIPEPNYLPVVSNDERQNPNADPSINADPTEFTDVYNSTFDHWISLLATGSKAFPANFDPVRAAAAPDRTTEIDPAWLTAERKRIADLPSFVGNVGVAPPAPNPNPSLDFLRGFVNQRASSIRMYVTRDSFQIRKPTSLNTEIFQAMVDCWLQGDVIRAIDAINTEALAKVDDPTQQNVGHSPIKRLIHLTVGAGVGQENSVGNLFVESGKGLDYSKSMTGRIGSDAYNVTAMDIMVDIDPSYINKFIAGLYKQNNGYTVVGVKVTAVDPFVAASNGYIYGNTQVVTLDLRVEALLFKGWTDSIMPQNFGTGSSPSNGGGMPGGMHAPGFGN